MIQLNQFNSVHFNRQCTIELDTVATTTQSRKCIFYDREKYHRNSRTREKLTCCMQLTAGKKNRKIATQRNHIQIQALKNEERIGKETCYNTLCYPVYNALK